MKRVFISQPMYGKTDNQIKNRRNEIIQKAKEKLGDIEVIDSFVEEDAPDGANPGLWYLGKSLISLSTADCMFYDKDGKNYRGTKIEHSCAARYGINIFYY